MLLILLIPTVLHAQRVNRSNYELLWRIDGPGMTSPSYLFGTMHLTDERVFEFSDSVLVALRSASSFAMEVDMDSMMAYMLAPGGPLLDTVNYMRLLFTANEYRYVDSLVTEKTGAPIAQLYVKRLWFLEQLLFDEEEALKKSAGPDSKPESIFLDGWLHQKATLLNKPIYSLEKIENQLPLMSANVSEVQKEIFLQNLGYHSSGNSDAKEKTDRFNARVSFLDSLVNLYYSADLQKISNLVNLSEELDDIPDLVSRNREMAANLSALISKGSVFAAVGVAHLPGEKGILSLLRAKGYITTPVKATFTGAARKERQRLDSINGFTLNRIADGYSVAFPGNPIAYPIPNINRKMYIGANNIQAGFAFCVDITQLGIDDRELVNTMIANMAQQGNAEIKKSYPITYRNVTGTEAVMSQKGMPLYMRLFIRNNRAFIFMHSSQDTDSSSRSEFFKSVRFYDITRPATTYDTLRRPDLGFTAIIPSDANHVQSGNREQVAPVEAYTGLDDANNISYIVRIDKMQSDHYRVNDKKLLQTIQTLLLGEDSTLQLIDSTVTEREGLPLYKLIYQRSNGVISRLHFIPRGNLAYSLLCNYYGNQTDSSYRLRFFDGFHRLPLLAKAPTVAFTPADSSFTITGPGLFTGGIVDDYRESSRLNIYSYSAMDSTSYSMYMAEVRKYSHYFHNEPDSLLKTFIHPVDTNFIITSQRQSILEGLPVYETEMKGRNTGLRWHRKAIVAGHTIYRLTAVVPEELAANGYAQQFLAAFHPGSKGKADTFKLAQKKLPMLLRDLQSSDTAIFNKANKYLFGSGMDVDSTDKALILSALTRPFPADTGSDNAKLQLLLSLKNMSDDNVINTAEMLFAGTTDVKQRRSILRLLTGLSSDSAIRSFLRLAPEIPENNESGSNIFSYSFREDSLYKQYMPAMVATAARSKSFLEAFASYTSGDSLWLSPQFEQYELRRLLPGITQLFEQQIKRWQERKVDEDDDWVLESQLLGTGEILTIPSAPALTAASFRQLLTDTVISVRALGARGLMSRGIRVDDKILNSILADQSEAYSFIKTAKDNNLLTHIRHLLTQDLLGSSYVAYYMSDDYEVTAIEPVTRIKVQEGKQAAEWIILYRYKTDESEDWQYILNGPHPPDRSKLNFQPVLVHWIEEEVAKDKKQLSAKATEVYKEYLEDSAEEKAY
ncbi:TraB/GumN family protein [Chitinophaga filiformis]|nr:TraB/GumN family protein [Chitinophaga filiformis]